MAFNSFIIVTLVAGSCYIYVLFSKSYISLSIPLYILLLGSILLSSHEYFLDTTTYLHIVENFDFVIIVGFDLYIVFIVDKISIFVYGLSDYEYNYVLWRVVIGVVYE